MHTDTTLAILDNTTTELGQQLRDFQNTTCTAFQTCELRREAEARKRRQKTRAPAPGSSTSTGNIQNMTQRQAKVFNLQTYKVHALGDYVSTIKMFGTTDSYSTAIVSIVFSFSSGIGRMTALEIQGELEHRNSKTRYRRTSKKHFVKQLAQIERRQARLRRIRQRIPKAASSIEVAPQNPKAGYQIGQSDKLSKDIGAFLRSHAGDPAVKVVF